MGNIMICVSGHTAQHHCQTNATTDFQNIHKGNHHFRWGSMSILTPSATTRNHTETNTFLDFHPKWLPFPEGKQWEPLGNMVRVPGITFKNN